MPRDVWRTLPKITEVMKNNMPPKVLYDTFFRHRGMLERFTYPEKKLLGEIVNIAWRNRKPINKEAKSVLTLKEPSVLINDVFGRPVMIPWLGEISEVGQYPNQETWATVPEDGAEGSMIGDFYYWANIHGLRSKDLARKRASELKATRDVRADLVAINIDYQRGERPASKDNGTREMTVFGQLVQDLKTEFFSIFTLSGHSPGTAFKCIENDMPLLDLTPLPLLVEAAERLNFLEDDLIVATCDEGALELGVSLKNILEKKKGKKIGIAPGFKVKDGVKADVKFTKTDLENVKGKTVFIGEDMIDSGKSVKSAVIDKLLNVGAKRVIVLVTHAVFSTPESGGAERLGGLENVEIIITNSIRAELPEKVQATQEIRKNIHFVDVIKPMQIIIRMDKEGLLIDIHSNKAMREKLSERIGLDIAPWLISENVDEAEVLVNERYEEIYGLPIMM